MFRQTLYVQWKAARLPLLPFVVLAFALPLLSVQGMGGVPAGEGARDMTWMLIQAHELWMPLFPIMAFLVGTVAAVVAWYWDQQGDHMYALSLPAPRWEYVLLKMGAGAVVMGACVVAFAVGAALATTAVHLPDTLHAYPWRASLRFLLAALTAYAVVFALAAGSVRTTIFVLVGLVAMLFLGELAMTFLGGLFPALQGRDFPLMVIRLIQHSPGPLHVFTGNWMLIDG